MLGLITTIVLSTIIYQFLTTGINEIGGLMLLGLFALIYYKSKEEY